MLIREKGKSLYEDLKKKHGKESEGASFKASHGWFHPFKAIVNIFNVKVMVSAYTVATWEFPEMLWEIVDEGVYLPEQVFNVGKTGLHWKRMPDWSYISKEENLMPGYKAAKDRLALLFGGNASSIMKLKPLLVYDQKTQEPEKHSCTSLFLLTPKPALYRPFSRTGFLHHFILEVEKYCLEKDIPLNILLPLDNVWGAPIHGWLSSQGLSSTSAKKYYITHPTYSWMKL